MFTRSQGVLKALDPTNGNELWNASAPGTSVPGLIGDGVVAGIDGPRCTLRRLAAASGASQVTATVGYAYGNNATTRSCVMGPSVLTENGRVAVSTSSTATFAVPGCGGTSSNQLWGAASTVTVLDATLNPIWTATDATIGCGTPPAGSAIAPFGFAATDTTIFVLSLEVNAYPANGCDAATCHPAWTAPLGGRIAFYEPVVAGDVLISPAWEGHGLFFDARGCGAAICTNLPGDAPDWESSAAPSPWSTGGSTLLATPLF